MKVDEIENTIIEVLKDVQEMSGNDWNGIQVTASPFNALPNFDSLLSIETTVLVGERLGKPDLGVHSIFISENGKKALSVHESAQLVMKLLIEGKG